MGMISTWFSYSWLIFCFFFTLWEKSKVNLARLLYSQISCCNTFFSFVSNPSKVPLEFPSYLSSFWFLDSLDKWEHHNGTSLQVQIEQIYSDTCPETVSVWSCTLNSKFQRLATQNNKFITVIKISWNPTLVEVESQTTTTF